MNKPIVATRPGIASTFTPADGSAKECITSADVIASKIFVCVGIYNGLSTHSNRGSLSIIIESKEERESSFIKKLNKLSICNLY